jgi:hypothetical protein
MKTLTKFLTVMFVLCLSLSGIAQPITSCPGYRTQTQYQWSCTNTASASYSVLSNYLTNNFAAAFPAGLTIGCNNTLLLTNAKAVRDFLPQTSGILQLPSGVSTNPGRTGTISYSCSSWQSNMFAGNLVALALNIRFDEYAANWAPATGNLKDLLIDTGLFKGWTVKMLFDTANARIGGCTVNSAYTNSILNAAVSKVNSNYLDCNVSGNYLVCPMTASGQRINPACGNSNTGSINITPSNGLPPYSYQWSNGATTQNIASLGAGTYTVTINDFSSASGFTAPVVLSFTVTQPDPLIVNIDYNPILCNGQSTAVNVAGFGGTGSISGTGIFNLNAGTYTYTITDANGCNATSTFTIPEPTALVTSSSATPIACNGGNSTITINANGGTSPYTGTGNFSVNAGSYSYNVTDANGCSSSQAVSVSQPTSLSATATSAPVACFGGNTVVTVSANGGTAPYSGTGDFTVASGNYSYSVVDANGCTTTATLNVAQPTTLQATGNTTAVSCNGGFNGSIALTVSGGTAPYSYLWSNGATSKDISGVSAGNYNVTITDASGCTNSLSFTITQPSLLTSTTSSTNISCFGGANGTTLISVNGGTTPYTYSWNVSGSGSSLSGLTAGNYSVNVTDANGCTTSATYNLTQPTALAVTITKVNLFCNGGSNGHATATPSGGTAPYTYLWSTGATTAMITGRTQGNYTVTVTDANGCTKSGLVCITQPAALSVSTSTTNVSCFGGNNGTASATVSGGTPAYTYLWSTGGNTSSVSGLSNGSYTLTVTDSKACTATRTVNITQPTAISINITSTNVSCNGGNNGSASASVSGGTAPYTYSWDNQNTTAYNNNLAAGTYTLTVTDANGCTITGTITISEPIALSASTSKTDVSCNGGNNGAASVNVSGGTSPYSYSWSNGNATSSTANLLAGTYHVTATDANGCTISKCIIIAEPTLLTASTTTSNGLCNGGNGTVNVSANGGTTPYTGTGSFTVTAGTYSYTVTDANGCTATTTATVTEPTLLTASTNVTNVLCNGGNGSLQVSANGGTSPYTGTGSFTVAAGTYNYTVTDANGCTATTSATVTEPTALSATTSQTNVSCNGGNNGSASVYATGGTAPYTYAWSNTDNNSTTNNLSAGTYSVVVTDANGCTYSTSVTITEPALLTSSTTSNDVTCYGGNDGNATITANGGTAPYTYEWNTRDLTASIYTIPAGSYTATVTDANGCTSTSTVTINQGPELVITSSITEPLCNGGSEGSATVTVNGGTAPYTYSWTGNASTSNSIANVVAGTYTVNVTDANGCIGSSNVVVTEPAPIAVVFTATPVTCHGGNDGSAIATASGGTDPYTYRWACGINGPDLTGRTAGLYTLVVTDANGCTGTFSTTITEPNPITLTVNKINVSCNKGSNGAINIIATNGGTAPYTYLWSTGNTGTMISGIPAGNYKVTITDANGCSFEASYTITQPTCLSSYFTKMNVKCNGGSDGFARIFVSGGTTPYTYLWSTGATTVSIHGRTAGMYTITVTDANGCTMVKRVTIIQPSPIAIANTITNESCNGGANGAIATTVTGGSAPYTYLWSNAATTASISNLAAGSYTITVKDKNLCTATKTLIVNEPTQLTASITSINVSCNGGSNGSAVVTASGGTAPYSYSWNVGGSSASNTNLSAGTYTVVISDANGCTTSSTVTITEPAVLSATTNQTDVSCNGGNNGSASVNVSGGTIPYTYSWSNGSQSATSSNLTAGTYLVTITDANGCTLSKCVIVGEPTSLSASISSTNVSCNGGNNGSATVTAVGGTAPYTYAWSNVCTTASNNNLTAGNYSVVVSDANGCTYSTSVTITEPAVLTLTTSSTNVLCNGGSDGSASVIANGGTAPYTYAWSNGGATANASNLTAGAYSVVVTDANNCSATASIAITQPTSLTLSFTTSNVSCNGGNNGSATANANGGTAPYTYAWSNGGATATINNLIAGTYTVTITDANGCSIISNNPISNTVLERYSNYEYKFAPAPSGWNTTIGGWSTGDAPFGNVATGSQAASQYNSLFNYNTLWPADGADGMDLFVRKTIDLSDYDLNSINWFLGVDNGYALYINGQLVSSGNAEGYTYEWEYSGTIPSQFLVQGNNLVAVALEDHGSLTAFDMKITGTPNAISSNSVVITEPTLLTATTTTTNALCNGGNGTVNVNANGGTAPYSGTGSFTVAAGTYNYTVTDANGCTATTSATVTEPTALTISMSNTNVSCNAGANGTATATVSGGVAPYSYVWSNAAVTSSVTGLSAGTYSVIATDANGCTITGSVTITQPTALQQSITSTNVTCNGGDNGSGTITVTGGTSPYSYLWSNGNSNAFANGLPAGSYTVTATDANGCTILGSVTITQPSAIAITFSKTTITCFGGNNGSASANVSGGVAPYSYQWSSGEVTSSISNKTAGNYTVTVTDANGCTMSKVVCINQNAQITANAVINHVTCNGGTNGSSVLTTSGGTAPYSYAWVGGGTGNSITNKSAGIYNVLITDINGCTNYKCVIITQPTAIGLTTTKTNAINSTSATGTATVSATGGTGTYSYLWSSGETTTSISNKLPGTYTVTVTDANGCTASATVTICTNGIISLTTSQVNVTCNGGTNGSCSVSATGGNGTFTYLWSDGSTTNSISNKSAGTYTVTVTDGTGTNNSAAITLTQPAAVTVNGTKSNVTCNGGTNGGVVTTVSNFTGALSYLWSDLSTASTISNKVAGTYTVTVTDANGCKGSKAFVLTQPAPIVISIATTPTTIVNCSGTATATVSGGAVSPLTYSWSTLSTTNVASGLCANATATVTVTDANGCTKSKTSGLITCGSSTSRTNGSTFTINEVFPVPCNDQLSVVLNGESNDEFVVTIMDIGGRILTQQTHLLGSTKDILTINTMNLASQVAIISIEKGGERTTGRIIIQH